MIGGSNIIKRKIRNGFTLTEVLLTLGVFVVIAATAMPSIGAWQNSSNISSINAEIKQALVLARERSISCKNDSSHGVYFDVNSSVLENLIIYQGDNYSARNIDYDIELNFGNGIDFSSIDNINEINFAKNNGVPNVTTTIMVLDESSGGEKVVVVNEIGVIY
jgi:prepilin-type N-terminal cleavage/methylation domain-containing protein